MTRDSQNGLQCSQFEALLADALDAWYSEGEVDAGTGDALAIDQRKAFEAHHASCASCGPMFEEVLRGMALVRTLPEVDPPKNLVHNILARTSRAELTGQAVGATVKAGAARRWLGSLRPTVALLLHSRFATSFAMAFFSLSLTLTLAGVKIADIAKIDWRPSALRKSVVLGYNNVEARVMRYYDNMRVVYEGETVVQKLKKAAASPQNNKQEQNQNVYPADENSRPKEPENVVSIQERDVPFHQAHNSTGDRSAESSPVDEGAQL